MRIEKQALMAREGGCKDVRRGCDMGIFLRIDQAFSVAEVRESPDSHGEENSRRVGEPNGFESSGCPGQSIDDGEIGRGLKYLAEYLWWEVCNEHRDHRSFAGSRYGRWPWGYEIVAADTILATGAIRKSVRLSSETNRTTRATSHIAI